MPSDVQKKLTSRQQFGFQRRKKLSVISVNLSENSSLLAFQCSMGAPFPSIPLEGLAVPSCPVCRRFPWGPDCICGCLSVRPETWRAASVPSGTRTNFSDPTYLWGSKVKPSAGVPRWHSDEAAGRPHHRTSWAEYHYPAYVPPGHGQHQARRGRRRPSHPDPPWTLSPCGAVPFSPGKCLVGW